MITIVITKMSNNNKNTSNDSKVNTNQNKSPIYQIVKRKYIHKISPATLYKFLLGTLLYCVYKSKIEVDKLLFTQAHEKINNHRKMILKNIEIIKNNPSIQLYKNLDFKSSNKYDSVTICKWYYYENGNRQSSFSPAIILEKCSIKNMIKQIEYYTLELLSMFTNNHNENTDNTVNIDTEIVDKIIENNFNSDLIDGLKYLTDIPADELDRIYSMFNKSIDF